MTVQERVNAGSEFLDKKYPDWPGIINSRTLRLNNCRMCILGQLFGHFMLGLERMGLLEEKAVKLGFQGVDLLHKKRADQDYNNLNKAWRKKIRERRKDLK